MKQDRQDRLRRQDMTCIKLDAHLPHHELTSTILECCFDVVNELGIGFLESVYKNALFIALKEKKLTVSTEQPFEIYYKKQKIGIYKADIVVNNLVIVELKCCKCLLAEHQAQVINYLVSSGIPVGLLVNFNKKQLEYKRLHHPLHHPAAGGDPAHPVFY